MRKTLHKKLKCKRKNIKTKKHLREGGGMMGDLGEHVFIGYKIISHDPQSGYPEHMPIMIPKNFSLAKIDINYSHVNAFDFSNGLSDAMIRYFGRYGDSGQSDYSFQGEMKIASSYNVYLPYLNQLSNIGKINIYDLMNKGMKFIDENNIIINIMFGLAFNSHNVNLENLKDTYRNNRELGMSYLNPHSGLGQLFNPLMENIFYKKKINRTDPSNASAYGMYKQRYDRSILQIENLFTQYPLLKEFIQDLEYRYPAIIEPILLVDETAIYNYANGLDQTGLKADGINLTSRVP